MLQTFSHLGKSKCQLVIKFKLAEGTMVSEQGMFPSGIISHNYLLVNVLVDMVLLFLSTEYIPILIL